MKRIPHPHGLPRFLLLIICVSIVSACFLFLPLPQKQKEQAGFYRYFSGSASDASDVPVDMLGDDRYQPDLPEITQCRYYHKTEAETLELPKGVSVMKERSGYSGKGYVGTLPAETESALVFPIHVPQTQHYEITVCAAAEQSGRFALRVNGELLTQFSMNRDERFTRVTFYGIFLEEGDSEIAIDTADSELEVDYLECADDSSVYDADFSLDETLCDPDASAEAQRLYAFMCENWETSVLTGQYAATPRDREINLIYQMTGQLPAIRFSALGGGDDREQIEAAIDWNVYTHGIVGLMWQWNAPDSESVYTDETDFNLYAALRHKDPQKVAMLTPEEAERAVAAGALSEEAFALLRDIDEIAETLRPLTNMDIPVLWRPLHEAGGGWYWWGGAGKNAYIKLWELLYYRMTEYHRLHNLIWVWNGQSAGYLVPETLYDIASVDIYLQPQMEYGSRYEQFLSLKNITGGKKLLAISECSALPDPDMMVLDRAVWSFFGLWYGDYLMNPDGTFNDSNYSSNDLYNLYNSEQALTLNDFLSLYQ